MKQNIFETRQRADELLKKAIEIWHNSEQSDYLDGIENDPVFSLLMTALAYQANETENEIVHMKDALLEEFANMLTPFELGHAMPATAVVETALQENIPEATLGEQSVFTLGDGKASFIPLLHTRVLNTSLRSIARMDGRRWKVSLSFGMPISDISGFAFAIKNSNFRELRVSVKGQPLMLVNPWDFSELPLLPCFALDTILYNKSQTYSASSLCLDLFARQNIRLFCVKHQNMKKIFPVETENIDLVFEFVGTSSNFLFDKTMLSLNTAILVNAQIQQVTISPSNPIVRIAGYGHENANSRQFLHLIRPSDEQMYSTMQIDIRRAEADRFNQGGLVKLLHNLITKYYSDYYAFMHVGDAASDKVIHDLAIALNRMLEKARGNGAGNFTGVYMMLRASENRNAQMGSLDIKYVTTPGASINSFLTANSQFAPPSGFDAKGTRQIASPVLGFDEIHDERTLTSLTRYYLATNDRLVTPADIKLFCRYQLLSRHGIVKSMIRNLSVTRRMLSDMSQCGYEIYVEIMLAANNFIKRGFAGKLESEEMLLQSMISVRCTNIYPVRVSIKIEAE
ncbi:MAG: hypothetical protein K6F33_08630 [Bacteroidales bacterium]|nr:hypothetical protein [Bacteroidales bacterium]